ncbi:hypothetical protein [Phytoactinopolyspora limicola]|uniref:hypothetical protein n=1 Tax=Phytoactinopolyspora limicola TaxID=2715536 RepID=UPI0014090C5A|nr:hypothetical protein [Phytoactinopolyspora limicola]
MTRKRQRRLATPNLTDGPIQPLARQIVHSAHQLAPSPPPYANSIHTGLDPHAPILMDHGNGKSSLIDPLDSHDRLALDIARLEHDTTGGFPAIAPLGDDPDHCDDCHTAAERRARRHGPQALARFLHQLRQGR